MAQVRSRTASHPSARAAGKRSGATKPAGERAGPQSAPEVQPLCSVGFCPICAAVTTLSDIKPELVEHLMVAGREMLLAFRSIIDARLEGSEQRSKLQRITVE